MGVTATHITGPIRDQRVMIGDVTHATVAEVEAAWQAWADTNGLALRARAGDTRTDLRESKKTVVAYITASKWFAKCPTCNGGIACWPENPRGCCLDCGTIYRVNYPSGEEIARATVLLGQRKQWQERNWRRDQGETLDEVAEETARISEVETGHETEASVVHVSDIANVLGEDAVEKLRLEGLI